jgi:hypothetical protein
MGSVGQWGRIYTIDIQPVTGDLNVTRSVHRLLGRRNILVMFSTVAFDQTRLFIRINNMHPTPLRPYEKGLRMSACLWQELSRA